MYVALTNNSRRKAEQVDGPNPRAENAHGQIVELVPPGEGADADHAATEFGWNMLLLAGDPAKEGSGAMYGEGSEAWFSSPDNVAIDPRAGSGSRPTRATPRPRTTSRTGCTVAMSKGRARRGQVLLRLPQRRRDVRAGVHAGRPNLFVAPQHPGELADFASTFEKPASRWPDFQDGCRRDRRS